MRITLIMLIVLFSVSFYSVKVQASELPQLSTTEQEYFNEITELSAKKSTLQAEDVLPVIEKYLIKEPESMVLLHLKLELLRDAYQLSVANTVIEQILSIDNQDIDALFTQCIIKEAMGAPKNEYLSCYQRILDIELAKKSVGELIRDGANSYFQINLYLMSMAESAKNVKDAYLKQLDRDIASSKQNKRNDSNIRWVKKRIENFDRNDWIPMPPAERKKYNQEKRGI